MLDRRDDFSAIADDELDRIRERARADLIKVLRTAIDDINRLPDQGPAQNSGAKLRSNGLA